jgi:hypothetical protein
VKAREVRKLDPSRSLGENAARIVQVRLDEMLAFAPPALDGKTKAQHDCDVMLPRVRGHLKELQRGDARTVRERAGRAPDLDPRLAAQSPHRTAYRGLDVLAVYLEARRDLLDDRFVAFWKRQEETGTWKRLEGAVEGYLRRCREARRTAKAAERARRQAEAAARAAAQAEAQAGQARLDRERVSQDAEEQAERHEQIQRRITPATRRPT